MEKLYQIGLLPKNQLPDDELLEFLRRLFPDITKETWPWEYRNSLGDANVYLARYDHKLAGHYAFIAYPLQIGGNRIPSGKAECAIIDKEVTRAIPKNSDRRVFLNLVRKALSDAKDAGVAIVFGFPNEHAEKIQVEGGFRPVSVDIHYARCVLRVRPLPSHVSTKRRLVGPVYNNTVARWLRQRARKHPGIRLLKAEDAATLDNFCQTLGDACRNAISVPYDWPFINWRYNENPYGLNEAYALFNEDQAITGFVGMRLTRRDDMDLAEILDINSLDGATMDSLLRFSIWWGLRHSVDFLELWTNPHLRLYALLNSKLRNNGFRLVGHGARTLLVSSTVGDWPYDPKNWYLSKSLERI